MVRAKASNIVLVVEDEPLVRLCAVECFADVGFTVLEATEASGALRILEMRNDIDAVFTDVNMPGEIDGLRPRTAIRARLP